MIAPKAESKPRELVPTGNHIGTLYKITYVGTVNTGFKNDDGSDKYQYKVRLTWELPNELRDFGSDGEEKMLPMSISREMTFSLYKSEKQTAVLRTIAHAMLGTALTDQEAEAFDIDELLGKSCMIDVSHEVNNANGMTFAKATTFSSVPNGFDVPAQINENKVENVSEMSREDIDAMPEFIREKMKGSKEYELRFNAPRSEAPQAEVPDAVKEAQSKDAAPSPF